MPDLVSWTKGCLAEFAQGRGLRAQLLRGGAGSIIVKIAATLLGLCVAVILARNLGAEGYGIYTYAFTLVSLLAIPAQFGLPNLVVRETAKAHALEQWGLMRGLWHWTNRAAGVLSISLALLAAGIAWGWKAGQTDVQFMTFAAGLLLMPLIALGNLRGAALRGLRKIVVGQLPEHVLRPALLIALTVCVLASPRSATFSATTAMSLHAVAALLAFFVGSYLLRRARPKPLSDRPVSIYQSRAWLLSTIPLGIVAAMQLVNDNTDILMLGLFLAPEDVGIYKIAVQLSVLVSFPITAINLVIAPHISRLHTSGELARMQRMVTISAIAVFSSATVIVGALALFGTQLIELLFGPEFRKSYAPMVVLASGQLIVATLGSLVTLANMTGNEKSAAKIIALGAAVNIALNAILIPRYGIMGAAFATVAGLFLWRVVLFLRLRAQLGINPSIIGMTRRT